MATKRARIAIDCRSVSPRPSGIGEMVQALVRHLPDLAHDCDFTLLRHPDRTAPLSAAPNTSEIVVRAAANGPATLLRLGKAVNLSGVDLFHATANIQPGGLTMPCITTVHDIMWLTHPHWCNPGRWGQIERRFYGHGIRRALSCSAAIATVSKATRTAILAYAPGLAGKVFVTRSGVSGDFKPVPRDGALLRQAGLDPARRFCLVVGQGAPYKNQENALRAFGQGFAHREDIDLVLIQRRGKNAAQLERIAGGLGIAHRLHFLPAVDRALLIQLYCSAEALLHPSLCEGFGNPVAEAMACGCPVVTSAASAMPEVAGGAAALVDPLDVAAIATTLRHVVEDPPTRDGMRQRGLARAAQLDWRSFAAANLALYRRVLDGAG